MSAARMRSYLNEVQYAVENLLLITWKEIHAIAELDKVIQQAVAASQQSWDHAMSDRAAAGFERSINDAMLGILEQAPNMDLRDELQRRVADHKFSTSAVAGAVLQIAKQGISVVFGGKDAAETGRSVGRQCLRDVIWHARNQSMHWEEPDSGKNQSRRNFFAQLEAEFGQSFGQTPPGSRALEVVELLQWRDWPTFQRDMLTLCK